ncbi:MAG: DUF2946 family protein [Erythrobacter sp.]
MPESYRDTTKSQRYGATEMARLRALICDHVRLTLVLLALALAVKAVVPTGFMLSAGGDRFLAVTICSDASSTPKQMQIAIPGKQDTGGDHSDAAAKATQCAFSGLGHSALGGADPLWLAGALSFILLIGLAPRPALPRRDLPFLRPQLRGPPLSV